MEPDSDFDLSLTVTFSFVFSFYPFGWEHSSLTNQPTHVYFSQYLLRVLQAYT